MAPFTPAGRCDLASPADVSNLSGRRQMPIHENGPVVNELVSRDFRDKRVKTRRRSEVIGIEKIGNCDWHYLRPVPVAPPREYGLKSLGTPLRRRRIGYLCVVLDFARFRAFLRANSPSRYFLRNLRKNALERPFRTILSEPKDSVEVIRRRSSDCGVNVDDFALPTRDVHGDRVKLA